MGEITEFVYGLSQCSNSRLETLVLHFNGLLGGNLPYSLGALKMLKILVLSSNSFWGSIPKSIGNLSSLQEFDLSRNKLNGTIPEVWEIYQCLFIWILVRIIGKVS